MKSSVLKHLLCLLISLISLISIAQESESSESTELKKHRISLGLGHTHIPSSELIEGRNKLAFASWTLDYDFHFNERWALGLQTDLIMESFIIKRFNQEEIERDYPFSVSPVVLFKPFERWSFVAGVGAEFAPGETLGFTRLGVEYGIEISENWEFGITFLWDAKWEYYNSWGLALMISRLW